jgi:hypothetical protein
MQHNPQLELANNFVQHTNRNIFLTGKAGTGKTTFLHQLKKTSHKRMAVVAPTGVAAINAGGVTIHSLFQLTFTPYLPQQENTAQNNQYKKQFNREKINLIQSLDLLVIDEISMVRADVLDAMDEVLRRYRNRSKPFGGVQLLMIGDLHQLSPVAKPEEWQLLKPYYDTLYFFSSKALKETPLVNIELKHIYRQSDTVFIDLLNAIRENRISKQVLSDLNQRYIPDFKPDQEGYITLTTHNNSAQNLNVTKLAEIKQPVHQFKAVIQGEFPEYAYPTVADLELKVGAQVMFVKNDSSRDKLFYNGKIGKVVRVLDKVIYIKCPGEEDEISVGPVVWQNIKYALNSKTKEIEETIAGSFTQYPLRLAWAITIHKSQGLTFEKAIIDAERSFSHGQVYVALSRCKTLEGMVLSSPLTLKSVITDQTIAAYTRESERNEPTENILTDAKRTFQETLLRELFDFNLIKMRFFSLLKLAEENDQALVGNLAQALHEIKATAEKEIYAVADKFQRELNQLLQQLELPENHEGLQERIKKASAYFALKVEQILFLPLKKQAVETDNKAIRKSVQGALSGLKQELTVKLYVTKQTATNGFNALAYLQNKANAAIDLNSVEEKVTASPQNQTATTVLNVAHPELFNMLRNWRNQLADEKNIPPFHIFSQKVLTEMVTLLPSTLTELESIKGMGPVKVKQFGQEILKLINTYCEEKQIQRQQFELEVPQEKAKADTKKVSFDLFSVGETVTEIAAERGLTSGTIESHLLHFVDLGELEITRVFPQEMVNQISSYLSKNQPDNLNEAKAALGDAVSYGAIRAVIKQLNYQYPQKVNE